MRGPREAHPYCSEQDYSGEVLRHYLVFEPGCPSGAELDLRTARTVAIQLISATAELAELEAAR